MRRNWKLSMLVTLALLAQIGWSEPAVGDPGEAQLRGVRIARHHETGMVRFIGSDPGRPIARPGGLPASASPEAIARAYLDDVGPAIGLRDHAGELRAAATVGADAGRSVVRFQQVHRGVPVLAGEVVVNLDRRGNILSVGGELLPEPRLSITPRVSASDAERRALVEVAREHDVAAGTLRPTEPELWIYDSRLLGGPGFDHPQLAWRMDVSDGEAIRELVLVDAQLGAVALHFNQVHEAKNREICDANSTAGDLPCTSPVRTEGGGATGVADVNAAYDYSGETYDFFFGRFGRDSLDGAGMPLRSTVRFCPRPQECPYQNAFWNGEQMVYGAGFAVDDVVGHELAHGVTDFSSNLFYYYQSGAINESLSDVFGEFVDLTNSSGNDDPSVRWMLGEDVPGIGAIRNMANPPQFGHPDRMTSPQYHAAQSDSGGVHINSGVNNKATFLLTDGGSFNGRTVTALGITKVARLYYEVAANLLTSGSDFADLASALRQACATLAGAGTDGITAADCTEVDDALLAVEMDRQAPAAPTPRAPLSCPPDTTLTTLFFDDLENPVLGNWAPQTGSGTNSWFYPQNSHSFSGLDVTYARSGTTNMWGYDAPGAADYRIRMTSGVAIPAGGSSFLHFWHSYDFDSDTTRAYDGGVVELSTDGGATWSDAGPLFTHQGYNGTMATGFGNPLGGRSAFVRESRGYRSSRVSLSSLAGETVRVRFRIGTDSFLGTEDWGWFLDDIRIVHCAADTPPDTTPPDTTITKGPKKRIVTTKPKVRVSFSFVSTEPASATFRCRLDKAAWRACSSPKAYTVRPGAHTFRVRAIDAALNRDPTPAIRTFKVIRRV